LGPGVGLPAERFELPTNGLQNRCSTTELSRHFNSLRHHRNQDVSACVSIARAK
jgi:hypothetical protein